LLRWFVFNSVIAGIFALAWLVFRSGSKPSRLAYPCQQAAFGTAAAAFGAPVVAGILAIRRRVVARFLTSQGIALAGLGLIVTIVLWGYVSQSGALQWTKDVQFTPGPTGTVGYKSRIFHQTNCPQNPEEDHFLCLDDLIELMGGHGLKFYRSSSLSLTAGPEGIIAPRDVVIIKINYQWPERGGTNTDLLRGLIRRIVDHPDVFTGEVVVCENTQVISSGGFDRDYNNAQDTGLSPADVVAGFQAQGHEVSIYDWTAIRFNSVNEYSAGDMSDGYVVLPYDAQLNGRVSYPKFKTAFGHRVSLKFGIWTEDAGYDRARLKFINVPVLKSHHTAYGATAMVKNYMGVVTNELGTNSHLATRYGILGALLAEIRPADLNILDAIWINADPYSGPQTSYAVATRMDQLVASRDPVAGDMWAVNNILIPAFIAKGYSPPWPWPSADPENPLSEFRQYLDSSMSRVIAAGFNATNELANINSVSLGPPGEASDPEGSGSLFRISKHAAGYELSWSAPGRGGLTEEYNLYRIPLSEIHGPAAPRCEAALGTGTSAILSSLTDAQGYLVVGRNSVGDGSFGQDSEGHERLGPSTETVCP
jgi:uncharacterized protein (DUF362 family)